jgi:PilX N-terminal
VSRGGRERGSALVMTIIALSVLTVLGLGLTGLGMMSLATSANERELNEALGIADAGIAHARKLILWQEWSSFNQFLQRGDGVGCSGDELEAPPIAGPPSVYPSLPVEYPTDATQFIPLAGRSFGVGGYRVQVCDDNSTDIDLATGVLNTNPNADVNGRIFVRSRGLGQNGSAATIEITIGPDSMPAILVNGDLDLKGNPSVLGSSGAVHANGTLTLKGNPCAEQYYSATGTVTSGSKAGGGASCSPALADLRPSSDPLPIPILSAAMYKDLADYWLTADGKIMQHLVSSWVEVNPIPNGSLLGNWSAHTGGQQREWRANHDVPSATYYVEGNVVINGNLGSSGSIPLTILAEGFYQVTGNPRTTPKLSVPLRGPISVIAGTAASLGGSLSNDVSGLYYAHDQLDVAGSVSINGQLVAANVADVPYPSGTGNSNNPVRLNGGHMELTGNPTITYNGNGLSTAKMLAWRECRGADPDEPCGVP